MRVKPIDGNRKQWDGNQYRSVYAVYLQFLNSQKRGEPYQKAAAVRDVADKLGRSKGSIEALMMNISAIHVKIGRDYVMGYKPLANYSKKLMHYICKRNGVAPLA